MIYVCQVCKVSHQRVSHNLAHPRKLRVYIAKRDVGVCHVHNHLQKTLVITKNEQPRTCFFGRTSGGQEPGQLFPTKARMRGHKKGQNVLFRQHSKDT